MKTTKIVEEDVSDVPEIGIEVGMNKRSPHAALSGGKVERQNAPVAGWRYVQLVLILGSISAFGPLSIDMYLPSLPSLSHDLGASASAAQLTLSACLLGLALGQVIAGPLSDTLGRRRPLLVGLVAYILASLLCAFSPSIALLIGLRLVQGMAGAAGIVIARAIVRDLYSGIAGPTSALPMAVVIACLGISALTVFVLLCRSSATGAGSTTSSEGENDEDH